MKSHSSRIINTDAALSYVFKIAISAFTFSDRFPLLSVALENETVDQPNTKIKPLRPRRN